MARLNFSHGNADEHRARAVLIREIAARLNCHVALLGDLQGPKIRIARFTDKKIELQAGDPFCFSITHPRDAGNQEVVCIDYPDLVTDCRVGDELLLDDGRHRYGKLNVFALTPCTARSWSADHCQITKALTGVAVA